MKDERSGLERRLAETAEWFEGSACHWDNEGAAVIREAAEAIGEARRAMESVASWYRSLEMLEEWPRHANRSASSVMREVRAALARLGGGE